MATTAVADVLRSWRLPILAFAAAMVAGDLLALRSGSLGLTLAFGAAAVLSVLGRGGGARLWLAAVLLAFAVAHARADLAYRPYVVPGHVASLELPWTYEVTGRVVRPPELRDGGLRLVVAAESVRGRGRSGPAHGLILVQVRHAEREWAEGDELHGWLRLRRPRNFGNPGEFDYVGHLARRGIRVTSFLYRDAEIERRPTVRKGVQAGWRWGVHDLIERRVGGDEARVLAALVLGMGGAVPAELREAFARAGVSHILAVSGLHVGFVAAVGYTSIRWLLARSERLLLAIVVPRLAAALSLLPVFLYAGIAGSNVATGRAVLMAGLVFGAVLVGRQRSLPVALAVAAIATVGSTPGVSADVSFQLSFVAVAALLAAMERFQRWWPEWEDERLLRLRPRRAWLVRTAMTYGVVSSVALLATTPLVAYHFNRVSLAAPLANLVVTPILGSVVVPLGLLAALVYPLSSVLAGILLHLAAPLVSLSTAMVAWIAAIPAASFRVTTPSTVVLGVFFAAAIAGLAGGRRLRRIAVVAVAVVLAGHAGARGAERIARGELRITFLSVGQGDSTVVEFPDGSVMVVDGGGLTSRSFDVGERVVAPFLWQRGIRRVDVLVVTHPDWDHYGGLGFLAEAFGAPEVWVGDDGSETASWRGFVARVDATGARWVDVRQGLERWFGDTRVEVLWPPAEAAGLGSNDRSIVLALERRGERVLLPGDVERRGEMGLLAMETDGLRSWLLKAPHHGSRTSSTPGFVAAVAPEAVVLSAGIHNRFGLPNREVLRRYRAAGACLLRTDLHGAVSVRLGRRGERRIALGARGSQLTPRGGGDKSTASPACILPSSR